MSRGFIKHLNVIAVWGESQQAAHNLVYVLFEIGLLSLLISAAQRHFSPLQFLLLHGFSFGWSLELGKGKRQAGEGPGGLGGMVGKSGGTLEL